MLFGSPEMIEQAPHEVYDPPNAASTMLPVGTKVVSGSDIYGVRPIGTDPVTAKPVYETPTSAQPSCDRVSTTSKQSGESPAPTPPVGIISPQAGSSATGSCAAPKSWSGLAIFAAVVIGLWILAGASLRRFL